MVKFAKFKRNNGSIVFVNVNNITYIERDKMEIHFPNTKIKVRLKSIQSFIKSSNIIKPNK